MKRWIVLLVGSLVALVLLSVIILMPVESAEAAGITKKKAKAASKLVFLKERYMDSHWPLSDESVLRAVYEKDKTYLFTPFICNASDLPLIDPRMTFFFPASVKPFGSAEQSEKSYKLWRWDFDNTDYIFFGEGFGSVLYPNCRGLNEMIKIVFPCPGSYEIRYSIDGIMAGYTVNVKRKFKMELIEKSDLKPEKPEKADGDSI